MRFGIGIGIGVKTDHTLEEVGQQFSVGRERIRESRTRSLKRKIAGPSPGDFVSSAPRLRLALLLHLIEQVQARLGDAAIGLRAGERSPPGLLDHLIALPGIRRVERLQVDAGVGGALELVRADRRQHAHHAALLGGLDQLLRPARGGPSAPVEADDPGDGSAGRSALQQSASTTGLGGMLAIA